MGRPSGSDLRRALRPDSLRRIEVRFRSRVLRPLRRDGLADLVHILPAASVRTVVDVGVNMVEGRLTGDVAAAARAKALNFSPVPGGVGALTGAVLLAHTVRAAGKAV